MKQTTALDILKTGKNVFLTGSAGAGKTFTINQYLHYLRARQVDVAVTASTGIASTNINGMTIHAWAGIGIAMEMTDSEINRLKKRTSLVSRLKNTQVLVIDEISMLHRKQFDLINQVLKVIRENDQPFGGLQVLVAGDFFQLPPVGEQGENNRDKFAFMSDAWLQADFQICYLSEQHRQKTDNKTVGNRYFNLDLIDILNQIRSQNFTPDILPALQATFYHDIGDNRTRLYTHNANVQQINETELAKLTTETHIYHGWSEGDEKLAETIKKNVRNTPELTLKVGAKVMFIKNNSELNVYNGTMGMVVGFAPNISEEIDDKNKEKDKQKSEKSEKTTNDTEENQQILYPVVRLNTGVEMVVEYDSWRVEDEEGEILAGYYHLPLTLAWAITIHKSQGMTLDFAEVDLSKTFEKGQGYVALSRLKQLSGLKLLGLNEISLQLDPTARGADIRFLALSDEHESKFLQQTSKQIQQQHEEFIRRSFGTLDKTKIEAYEKRIAGQQKLIKQRTQVVQQLSNLKMDTGLITETLLETKVLLEQGMDISEISQQRELAVSTIIQHIEKLLPILNNKHLSHIMPEQTDLDKIEKAYQTVKKRQQEKDKDEHGNIKLRALFDYLQGEYAYNDIRLALLFIDKS